MSLKRVWLRRGSRLARAAFDTLVPRRCVVCGRGTPPDLPPVCRLCWHRLPRIPIPGCPRCGQPISWPVRGEKEASVAARCVSCDGWPDSLRAAAAPFAFDGGAARLVKALKYGRWKELAQPMGRAMAASAKRLEPGGDPVLVPVPLSPARLRERGFNQAELLSRALASTTGWRWHPVLVRRPGGRRQTRLAREARRENVRELFSAHPCDDTTSGVLLVDDVFTTGATAAACAETLHEAGFSRVSVVTFARTLRPLEVTGGPG